VHGGIPSNQGLNEIRNVDRFLPSLIASKDDLEAVNRSTILLILDLLWSDPGSARAENPFRPSPRGTGHVFGKDAIESWHNTWGFEKTIRAHQLVKTGVQNHFRSTVVTVFSASNYCRRNINKGGILKIVDGVIESVTWINLPMTDVFL